MTAWLAQQGVPPHILKFILGQRQHSNDATEMHFTFPRCEEEVRSANELWAAHVASL